MKVLAIHPAATAEVAEAVAYHEEQAEGLGHELRAEFERAFARIVTAPQTCPPHRRTGYRKCFVARFRYTVYFLELTECTWVAAIAHGSRRPDHWRGRSPGGDAGA